MLHSGRRMEKKTRTLAGVAAVFFACIVVLSAFVAVYADSVRYGVVTGTEVGLSVREGAGTTYTRLGLIYDGTTVTITGEKKASDGVLWYAIDYNGGTGYVSSQYIRQQKQCCGPAVNGGCRGRSFMREHGRQPPLFPVFFHGRSPVSGRKS